MVSYTPMDLNRQLILYNDKLNLDLDGKTIKEGIEIVQKECPKLHSTDEIKEYNRRNLKLIKEKFGFKALRIFYHSFIKDDLLKSFTGEDMLEMKYDKLIRDIKEYHNTLIEWIELQLDYYIYCDELESIYKEEYGIINDYDKRLYGIMKTLYISNYDKKIVNSLIPLLKEYLEFSGDKYYLKQDLTDSEVLDMLYEHISEEAWDKSQYSALDNIFVSYDGYGNEYYNMDYQESWSDDKGYHCKMWDKPSTIEDYIRRG